jgi:multidrug transporter EmrE-like cation transporter
MVLLGESHDLPTLLSVVVLLAGIAGLTLTGEQEATARLA